MNDQIMKVPTKFLAFAAVAVAVAGCGGGSGGGTPASSGPPAASSGSTSASVSYTPKGILSGLRVGRSADTKPFMTLVAASSRFGHRPDPFQLTSEEMAYDKKQEVERVFGGIGGFTEQYQLPPEETKEIEPEEVQPYRRLAGIVVGDSVLAIIDMGDGRPARIIRPGMKVPDTEWTVVSINEDRAILHRDGNVGPHTVSVRLEEPLFGGSTATGTGGGPAAGPQGPTGAGGPRRGMGPMGMGGK